MSRKKIFLILIMLIGITSLVYGINHMFFSPTKINSFIASKIYKSPANTAFTDESFYKCVVDAYNKENSTSLSYTTNLSDEQLKTIKSLSCSSKKITSVKGVEQLTNLTELNVNYNQLTEIDVSNNTALTELRVYSNQLKELNVSKNIALTNLIVPNNQLTELDVSNNTVLTKLYVSNNQLAEIDVSNNTLLQNLDVSNNQLTEIDVSKNGTLTFLDVGWNQLTEIDVSNNTLLQNLDVSNNQLTELDISNHTKFMVLDVSNNQLKELDVSKNPALISLFAYETQLKELDVSNNPALTELNVRSNQLTELDISNHTKFMLLDVSKNQLKELDVSRNALLMSLYVSSNQLTRLDVSNNTALRVLNVSDNQLTGIDVSNNTTLTELYASKNQLKELDVSNNTALTRLYASNNQLKELDVSNNTALTELRVFDNQLTKLDASGATSLKDLRASRNQLTEIDVSKNVALTHLDVSWNQLTELDVSNNTKLTCLEVYDNSFEKNIGIYKDKRLDNIEINGSSVKLPDGKNSVLKSIIENNCIVDKIDTSKAGYYQYDLSFVHDVSTFSNIYKVKLNLYVVELTSDKYYINDENEYIYTGNDIDKDTILNNINLNYGETSIEDNKLKIKYSDKVLQEYLMLSVNFGTLQVHDKNIVISDDILYDDFIDNITLSEGLTYKIFNGEDEVTSGNISKGIIVKIYYNDKVIDTYEVTDEYLDLSLLDVDEEKHLIKNLVAGTTVGEFKKKISTSGTITLIDINNNVLDDNKLITSGSKLEIKLSKKTYEYILSVKGDVNGDGKVTTADVSKVYRHIKKRIDISEDCYLLASDVNGDGKVTTADVSKIYRFVKKRIDSLN